MASGDKLRQIMRSRRRSKATRCRACGRTRPMTHFISVLLPLPLVPSSATVSPLCHIERDAAQRPHRAVAGIEVLDGEAKCQDRPPALADCAMTSAGAPIAMILPASRHITRSREAHHRLHDVLDHDDGDVLAAEADEQVAAPRRPRRSTGLPSPRRRSGASAPSPWRARAPSCAARPASAWP